MTQVPSNVNDAVSFIKKAGRNLLLTIERADVTEDQGEPTIFYVMSIYTLHMPLYKYISSISFDLKEDVSFKCLHHNTASLSISNFCG